MKDEIIAAIAAYLDTKKVRSSRVNSVEEYLPQWPLEKATIAKEIAAAIEPLLSQDSDWEGAPDWAKWRTVDIDSTVTFWEEKPKHSIHNNRWTTSGGKTLTKGLKCINWKKEIKQR